MIIPLDKLMKYNENKYVFTRAAMDAVDKISNLRDYPEENLNWKVVPNILKRVLDENIKFNYESKEGLEDEEEEQE